MLSAREINGYTQIQAAELFGYSNSTQLSLWEQGKRVPPLKTMIRACGIYRVSMDYLTGISHDPDRDPRTAERQRIVKSAESMLSDMAHRLAESIIYQTNLGGPTIEAAQLFLADGEKLMAAYRGFVSRNKDSFEEMLGGAKLAASADAMDSALASARKVIERHRNICEEATRGVIKPVHVIDNLPLFNTAAAVVTGDED